MNINKKRGFFISLTIFVALMFLVGCSSDTSADNNKEDNVENTANNDSDNATDEVFEMNVNNIFTSVNYLTTDVIEPWAELVEEKSNGRIKVNVHHGSTLGAPTAMWQDIQGGVYDVGLFAGAPYFIDTELYPLTIAGLPLAFPDAASASKVMNKFKEKYGQEANEKAILMGMPASDPNVLFTVKPISGVEDLKGLKIRASGKMYVDLYQDWGASPVSVPLGEVYPSLERKVVDAVVMTPTHVFADKIHEVAPYITNLDLFQDLLIPVMNVDFYNSLPEDLQKLFDEELNSEIERLFNEAVTNKRELAYEYLAEDDKVEVRDPSPEEMEKFKEPVKKIWDQWVDEANEKGYPGEEMMDYFMELIKEEGLDLPF